MRYRNQAVGVMTAVAALYVPSHHWADPALLGIFIVCAVYLAVGAALVRIRRGRSVPETLRDRTVRIANRVTDCAPGRHRGPAYVLSNRGLSEHARVRRSMERWENGRRPHRRRRHYTDRLHRSVVALIEELANHLDEDRNLPRLFDPLERFTYERPTTSDLEKLGYDLWQFAQKLPAGR